MVLDGQAAVGRPVQREPCYQEPVACRSGAHLEALGQGSLGEVERQALQTYEVVVLAD
jgi:hypothetical protein